MDFRLNENEQMVVDMCRRFAREQLAAAGAEADRHAACPPELITKGLELGLFVDAIPEKQGGYLEGEFSHTLRALRVMALSAGCPSITAVYEGNTEYALLAAKIGGKALDTLNDLGDPAKAHACLVLSRSSKPITFSGGKLAGVANGVPNAVGAKYFAVVSTEDAADPYVAIVTGAQVTAQRGMSLTSARVGNVSVDGATVVASVNGAAAKPLIALARNAHRVLAGALGVGSAAQALDYAEAYAADRTQFGQKIGKFESLARLIHENRARLTAAKYAVLAAAQALDNGADDATLLAKQASDFAGEASVRAAIDAVQVYGGYGFVNDYPVEKVMRDVRACTTLAGDGLREQILATALAA